MLLLLLLPYPPLQGFDVSHAGAEKIFDLGQLSEFEQAGLKDLIPELKELHQQGL